MKKLLPLFLLLAATGHAGGVENPPENVSLSLTFNQTETDEIFFDGSKTGTGTFTDAEFPYLIAEGDSHVLGIVAGSFIQAERELDNRNRLVIHRDPGKASFLLPFTEGDHGEVENRQAQVLGNGFLDRIEPSFSFFMPDEATVEVALKPNITIKSSISLRPGTHVLEVEKTGDEQVDLEKIG